MLNTGIFKQNIKRLIERIITTPAGIQIQCFTNTGDEMVDLIKGITFKIFTTEEYFNEVIICPEKYVLCSNGKKQIIRRIMSNDTVEENQFLETIKEELKN
jgi:hypothetical protein